MNGAALPSIVVVRDLVSGQEREVGRFNSFGTSAYQLDTRRQGILLSATTAGNRNVLRLDVSLQAGATDPSALLDSQTLPCIRNSHRTETISTIYSRLRMECVRV